MDLKNGAKVAGRLLRSLCGILLGGPRARTAREPLDYQRFVDANAQKLGHLTDSEKALLRSIEELTGPAPETLALLQQYDGPRERLSALLEWHRTKLELLKRHPTDVPLAELLDFPGFEEPQRLWTEYHAKGWRAVLDGERLQKTTVAQVFPDVREVVFRLTPSDEPLPLTVAEEIFHLEALDSVTANRPAIELWVRTALGEVVFAPLLGSVGREERFHWSFEYQFRQMLMTLPADTVQKAIFFLVERDAMAKKLDLYRQLISTHPEFRNLLWEGIAASSYPIARMSMLLNRQQRFALPPKFIENLGEHLLDGIVRGTGGETVADRERRERRLGELPIIKLPRREEIFRALPKSLRTYELLSSSAEVARSRRAGTALTDDELQQMLSFLAQPWIAEALALDLHRDVYEALNQLTYYDAAHGTNHALTAGIDVLARLRAADVKSGLEAFRYVFSSIAHCVERAAPGAWNPTSVPVPSGIKDYFAAALRSPVLSSMVLDPNGAQSIARLLELAANLPETERPDAAQVFLVTSAFIDVLEAQGVVSRDSNQYVLLTFARVCAQRARDYFRAIGDAPRTAHFEQIFVRLEEGMGRYRRNDPYR